MWELGKEQDLQIMFFNYFLKQAGARTYHLPERRELRAPILWTLLSILCVSSEAPSRSAPQPAVSQCTSRLRGGFIAGAQLQLNPGGGTVPEACKCADD